MSDLLAAPRGPQRAPIIQRLARSRMLWFVGIGGVLIIVLYYAIPRGQPAAPAPTPQVAMPNIPYDQPVAPPQTRAPPAPVATVVVQAKPEPQPTVQPTVENYPRITLQMHSFGGRSFVPEYLKPAQAAAQAHTKKEEDRVAYSSPKVPAIRSTTIADRTYELPAFTTIPCKLDTSVITGASGQTPFRCHISTPNGRGVRSPADVVLFEDNTVVGGFYKSTVTEGDNRVVMVTAQAETPFGVIVRFGDMPVADQLGAAGVPGAVDNHWGQRIGGALMLAAADTAASLAQAELQSMGRGNQSQFNFGGGGQGISGLSQVMNGVLSKTINIPPTVVLHQGDMVLLWMTEMVDFSQSYSVGPRERQ